MYDASIVEKVCEKEDRFVATMSTVDRNSILYTISSRMVGAKRNSGLLRLDRKTQSRFSIRKKKTLLVVFDDSNSTAVLFLPFAERVAVNDEQLL
jgi:hypothetical protein